MYKFFLLPTPPLKFICIGNPYSPLYFSLLLNLGEYGPHQQKISTSGDLNNECVIA